MALCLMRDMLNELNTIRPSRLVDQHFGLELMPEDLLSPIALSSGCPCRHSNYCRPWQIDTKDSGSTVHCNKDKFHVNLDVQQFAPEEITVKVADGYVLVEGKHEEKEDKHGFISRQFVRKYLVPKEYKIDAIESQLSSDGVLKITAPKLEAIKSGAKIIPITQTGPHKAVKEDENKEAKNE